MPSVRISKELNDSMYFITFTVKGWCYVFDRYNRWDILVESIKYCQENKGLKIYSYVFMLNHLHFIFQSPDAAGFIRDFKKHISFELMKNIKETEPSLLRFFKNKNGKYNFWEKTNMPKLIETFDFFWQKKQYIEYNPLKKGYVADPEHWIYSSASSLNTIEIAEIEI